MYYYYFLLYVDLLLSVTYLASKLDKLKHLKVKVNELRFYVLFIELICIT